MKKGLANYVLAHGCAVLLCASGLGCSKSGQFTPLYSTDSQDSACGADGNLPKTTWDGGVQADAARKREDPSSPDYRMHMDFDAAQTGPFTAERAREIVSPFTIDYWHAFADGMSDIVKDTDGRNALRVKLNAGMDQPPNIISRTLQFDARADRTDYHELYLYYRVKFGAGFKFQQHVDADSCYWGAYGGKLPGLAGGENYYAPASGNSVERNGDWGFSARHMWRSTERDGGDWMRTPIYTYLYSAGSGQSGNEYGTDIGWPDPPRNLEADRWYEIEQRIKLNTPGKRDGEIEEWLDRQHKLRRNNVMMIPDANNTFGINVLKFHTYFGGNNKCWSHEREEHLYYRDVIISTKRVAP